MPKKHTRKEKEVERAEGSDGEAEEAVPVAAGELGIIVHRKNFRMQKNIPKFLTPSHYYVETFLTMPRAEVVPYLTKLIEDRGPDGGCVGFIPAGKEEYAMLKGAGLIQQGVKKGDKAVMYSVVPSSFVIGCPLNDPDKVFVGVIKRRRLTGPLVIASTAELCLKSKVHAHQMVAALLKRMNTVVEPRGMTAQRCGDYFIHVLPDEAHQEADPPLTLNDVPVDILMRIPGISHLYDPSVTDPKLLETDSERKHGMRLIGKGAAGIPIISTQKALCLMSGGIDSPVAAYRMMCRGCHVDCVHYLNSTGDTAGVLTKLTLLCKRLSEIQGHVRLFVVDISRLQSEIIAVAAKEDRTLLYKLFMLMISANIPDYHFMCTGDSIGQVASQTPKNISSLYPFVERALVTPLSGSHKNEIIDQARHLGLFDFSIMRADDCCQFLTVSSGANLAIGQRKLRHYARKINVPELTMEIMSFSNGEHFSSKGGAGRKFPIPFVLPRMVTGWSRKGSPMDGDASDTEVSSSSDAPLRQRPKVDGDAATESTTKAAPAPSAPVGDNSLVYFDSAAGTMMDPRVRRAVLDAPEGNPNAVHTAGRAARTAVETVRFKVCNYLCPSNPSAMECYFTAGGTESNNIAIQGLSPLVATILISPITHPSIRETAKLTGLPVVEYGVDATGVVDLHSVGEALAQHSTGGRRCLLCVDVVNHELGTIAPVDALVSLATKHAAFVHGDACQAVNKVDFDASPFTSVAFTAHKFHGPPGVGGILVNANVTASMKSILAGGSGGLRPGTENVPGIVGLGEALGLARNPTSVDAVYHHLLKGLATVGGGGVLRLNGNPDCSSHYIIHATVVKRVRSTKAIQEAELLNILATRHNIMVSAGAACSASKNAATPDPADKPVYNALKLAGGPTLRISICATNTVAQADRVIQALDAIL